GVADAAWVAQIGYLVVRGTCDYCNSRKNDDWHKYAALIAAAYARIVVEYLHPVNGHEKPVPRIPRPSGPAPIDAPDLSKSIDSSGTTPDANLADPGVAAVASKPTSPISVDIPREHAKPLPAPRELDPIEAIVTTPTFTPSAY